MSVYIIADVGVNHNGSLERAKQLVQAAASAGADAVKFQAFTADTLEPPGSRRNMLSFLELKPAAFSVLADECRRCGVEFMCTPFDVSWLGFLHTTVGMRLLKLASSSITNLELLKAAARLHWHGIYLSAGAATQEEVWAAVVTIEKNLKRGCPLTLLHCVSAYPTRHADCNLWRISALAERYGGPAVGFSSHCPDELPAIVAVTMGARVIEQHITLDRNATGPDHLSSMEPDTFARMVRAVRLVPAIKGSPTDTPLSCERHVVEVRKERDAWRNSLSGMAATDA